MNNAGVKRLPTTGNKLSVRPMLGMCFFLGMRRTAEERDSWLGVLEAEERRRLEVLNASLRAYEAEPSPEQVNDLLVSALQAQATLTRMSRVFPLGNTHRLVDPGNVLSHSPTLALVCQLRRCWTALGVTDSTLSTILRDFLARAVDRTRPLHGHADAFCPSEAAFRKDYRLSDEGSGWSLPAFGRDGGTLGICCLLLFPISADSLFGRAYHGQVPAQ